MFTLRHVGIILELNNLYMQCTLPYKYDQKQNQLRSTNAVASYREKRTKC